MTNWTHYSLSNASFLRRVILTHFHFETIIATEIVACAFRFTTTPPISGPTATGARGRGPAAPASSSGGKWDRERIEKRGEEIPFCYGISLVEYFRVGKGELGEGGEGTADQRKV